MQDPKNREQELKKGGFGAASMLYRERQQQEETAAWDAALAADKALPVPGTPKPDPDADEGTRSASTG